MVALLLRPRLRGFLNAFTRTSARERGKAWRGLLGSLLVSVAVGMTAFSILDSLAEAAETDSMVRLLLDKAPSLGLFSAFWLLILSGVTVGIQTFYQNAEMGLLLASPLRTPSIFMAKLVEATITNATLFLVTAVPMLLVYASVLHRLNLTYLLNTLLVLAAFSALPTGLGVLASMLLMRILPAGRMREALAAAGVALFAVIYFFFTSSIGHMRTVDAPAFRRSSERLIQLASRPSLNHGPWSWAGETLAGDLPTSAAWLRIGMLWSVAAMSTGVCAAAASRLFFAGWSASQEADSGSNLEGAQEESKSARPVRGPFVALGKTLPQPVRAVYVKDMTTLRRDMRQLSMLFIPIAVVAVFLSNARSTFNDQQLGSMLFVQTLLVILAPISLRLALSAYIAENRAFWIVMGAPNATITALTGKFVFACALSLPLSLIAAGLYAWLTHLQLSELLVCLLLVACVAAAFAGIGVGASARFCDFSADNARFTITTGGRMAIFGIQIAFMILIGLLNAVSWALVQYAHLQVLPVMLVESLITAALSAGCVALMLTWGAARLKKLEW